MPEGLYSAFNIIGPLILLLTLIFFTVRQWKRRPREDRRTEKAARELREQMNAEDVGRPGGSR